MTDAVLKAIEAANGGTDLGAIQVVQGGTPVKIAKSTIVDANGNPISYAVLDVKGAGAAADALRVHLSTESLAALEQITATVSGPIALDSATLAALESTDLNAASIASITGTDGATPPTIAGTGIRGWLRAIFERLTAGIGRTWTLSGATDSVAVTGSVEVANDTGNPLPVSGEVASNITKVNGAAHSTGNPLFADITDRIARILGTVKSQQDGTWTIALDAPTLAALETINVGNFPSNFGVAITSGAGTAAGTPLFAQEVVGGAAVSQSNPVPTRNVPADLAVQAVGAAAAAVTLTIPAAGAGLFHYIDVIEIHLYNTAARTGAATPVTVTSTNLPGNLSTLFPSAGAIGTLERYAYSGDRPIRSAAANTATTIVCPAVTGALWHAKVVYSTGP